VRLRLHTLFFLQELTMGYKIYEKSLNKTPSGRYMPQVIAGRSSSRFEQYDGKNYATKAAAASAIKRIVKEFKGSALQPDKQVFEIRENGRAVAKMTFLKSGSKRRTASKRKTPTKRTPTRTRTKKKPARRGGFTGEGFGDPLGTMKFRGFM
jgi:hypothetical protein